MADKRIIQLPDTPGLDTTTDEMVVDNATDGARRVPVGRAGGVAILDANGKIISRLDYEGQPGGVATLDAAGFVNERVIVANEFVDGSASTLSTTAVFSDNPMPDLVTGDIVIPANALVLVQMDLILRNVSAASYTVGAVGYSEDGGATWTIPSQLVFLVESAVAGKRTQSTVSRWMATLGGKTVRFRGYFGNFSGRSDTIECHPTYRGLAVTVWR